MHCKQINHAIIIALILALSAGTSLAKPVTVKLRVKGMTCGGCATAVANALKLTEGVDEARISYKRGTAIVKYDDQKITVLKLREVINNIGFVCELPKSATKPDKD